MAYPDIDLNVSNEGKAMLREVTKFSMEVMRPAGIQLDKLPTPEEVIAPDSVLWQVLKGFRELGASHPAAPQGPWRHGRRC